MKIITYNQGRSGSYIFAPYNRGEKKDFHLHEARYYPSEISPSVHIDVHGAHAKPFLARLTLDLEKDKVKMNWHITPPEREDVTLEILSTKGEIFTDDSFNVDPWRMPENTDQYGSQASNLGRFWSPVQNGFLIKDGKAAWSFQSFDRCYGMAVYQDNGLNTVEVGLGRDIRQDDHKGLPAGVIEKDNIGMTFEISRGVNFQVDPIVPVEMQFTTIKDPEVRSFSVDVAEDEDFMEVGFMDGEWVTKKVKKTFVNDDPFQGLATADLIYEKMRESLSKIIII